MCDGRWIGGEVMKDVWVEVAAGLFFTTFSLAGRLSGAQQEYYTPCLLIHISHILVWRKGGGKGKQRQEDGERDLIQTGGHQWQGKNEAGMLCRGAHNSVKKATNQAQNWHTHALTNRCYDPSVQVWIHVHYVLMCTHPESIFRAVCVMQLHM